MLSKLMDALNRLKPRQLVMLAGVACLLLFLVIYFPLSALLEPKNEPAPEPATVPVVAAKLDIPAQTTITEDMLTTRNVTADAVPEGAVTDISRLVGHPSRVDIFAGDVITGRKFYEDMTQAGFLGLIPPDCRAMSIPINDVGGVSGFARPGDHVDVLLVSKNKGAATSKIILQKVLLLGIGKKAETRKTEGMKGTGAGEAQGGAKGTKQEGKAASGVNAGETGATATLALRPDDILKLAAVSKTGTLQLLLRPSKPTKMFVSNTDYSVATGDGTAPAGARTPKIGPRPPAQGAGRAPAPPTAGSLDIRGTTISQGSE